MLCQLIQDPRRSGHRGFGFVTFSDDGVADRVSRRTHEILGHEVRTRNLPDIFLQTCPIQVNDMF